MSFRERDFVVFLRGKLLAAREECAKLFEVFFREFLFERTKRGSSEKLVKSGVEWSRDY